MGSWQKKKLRQTLIRGYLRTGKWDSYLAGVLGIKKSNWKYFARKGLRFKGQAINVKNDKDGYSKTYRKQKVTKQQQKAINRRFKGQYSTFKDTFEDGFQETIPQVTGKCKWTWRCYNHLEYLGRAFKYWPDEGTTAGAESGFVEYQSYQNSQTQAVYFNKFKTTYEIYNPTNYDMNLVIYDLVCKQDSTNSVMNANYNYYQTTAAVSSHRDPIRCIQLGLDTQTGYYPGGNIGTGAVNLVSDPNQKDIYDITLKPTESYPFNIYWTIVKKHVYKLQPGATLTHVFIHKPKALFTRGYYAYRYGKDTSPNDGDRQRGIKNITSGCLFKYWGQVAGTGDSTGTGPSGTGEYSNMSQDHREVTTLSGRLMFKEYVDNQWYCMDPKYTYTWKTKISNYVPNDEEELDVVNDDSIKKADDADKDVTDGAVN